MDPKLALVKSGLSLSQSSSLRENRVRESAHPSIEKQADYVYLDETWPLLIP